MKKLFVVIFIFSFAYLTQQSAKADNVIIKGDTLWTIFFSPFDNYPGIVKLRERLADYSTRCTEDNCSFLSTWKIVHNRLMLAKIENCKCNEKQQTANLKNLFGNRLQNGMLAADWYTGEIWVTKDQPNSWGGMFAASWPRETRLVIENGAVLSVKEFVYPKPVITIYYRNTDSLNQFIHTYIDWTKFHHLPQRRTGFNFRFDQDTSGCLIHLKSIHDYGAHPFFDDEEMKEINRVAGLLQWPVYYFHGKPLKSFTGIFIFLGEDLKEELNKRN